MTKARVTALTVLAALGVVAACATSATSTGPSCTGNETACGGRCITLTNDPANCGACGTKCASTEVCSAGKCSGSCNAGFTACSGSCVDVKTDKANCGSCGKACTGSETCSQGKCGTGGGGCEGGTVSCGNSCVDTATDSANCGQCGNACSPGLVCIASKCACTGGLTVCPKVVPSGDGGAEGGVSDASSDGGATQICADLKTDNANCGACGNACMNGAQCKIGDGGTPFCYSPCGDGVLGGSEQCDDGNSIDNDGCSNTCTFGTITVAGNQRAWVKNALTALGATFTEYTTNQWAPAGGGGILIESNDGGTAPSDYATNIAAGTHVLSVGGSATAGWGNNVNQFVTTDNTASWHTLGCSPHWTKGASHPITQFLPATYVFPNVSVSYHMHHLANAQPVGAQLLGTVCDSPGANGVMAVRLANSKGTFTDLAFDATGSFADSAAETAFMQPFMKGYLAFVRGPH